MGALKLTLEEAQALSRPYFSGFNPYVIPYQGELFNLVRRDWDYSKGNLEILLSGSYGSAKSIAMAHLAITHCLTFARSRVCLARRSMPDLKDTIFKEIVEHLEEDPEMQEGVDYWVTANRAFIRFANGSEIISRSWADKKYKKGRSLKISMLIFEELTENNQDDMEAFKTLRARLRRLPHVPENVLIAATNPDEPDHWVYKYFMVDLAPHKFVFYSVTEDNPFLDPIYIEQEKKNLSKLEADRFLRGKWITITGKGIYHAYDPEFNFLRETVYEFDLKHPICLMHDFNIGHGKPMSAAVGQFIDGVFHLKKTYIVEGFRTPDILEEMADDGLFEHKAKFQIYGDATGKHADTRNNLSDWDIVENFLAKYRREDDSTLEWSLEVSESNPPIRTRHNKVNAYFCNDLGEHRFFIYKEAADADEGFRLTKLKKGSVFQEDDSFAKQHVTTAAGYWVVYVDEYGVNQTEVRI